jgi:hypothetical protein
LATPLTDEEINELLPDHITSIGVTGTREKLMAAQEHNFFDLLIRGVRRGATEVHHGACTGLDQFTHHHMSTQLVITHVHPPTDKKFSAESVLLRHPRRVDHEAKPYGERNQDIVDEADVLFGAPKFPEDHPQSKRSGTWQTIRKADAAGKLVLYADGNGDVYRYEREAA